MATGHSQTSDAQSEAQDPTARFQIAAGAADGGVLEPQTRDDLFFDQALRSIESRALAYLNADAPVHLRGPAGVGKTTLALHLAGRLGRPVMFFTGDGWHKAANLIGDHVGEKTSSVRDNYIHNVKKTESSTTAIWEDRALTIAMREGYTFVYDEFTRSSPEANNPLLAALEERVLMLPTRSRERKIIKAHPSFRAILTSNPADYAAVKAPQDALLDRMITFDLGGHSAETEAGVVARRSGLSAASSRRIVDLVRALRDEPSIAHPPSMRAAIMIARVTKNLGINVSAADERFVQLAMDVLEARAGALSACDPLQWSAALDELRALIVKICQPNLSEGSEEPVATLITPAAPPLTLSAETQPETAA